MLNPISQEEGLLTESYIYDNSYIKLRELH